MNGNDDLMGFEDESIVIDNDAVFTIMDGSLYVFFDGNRNIVMELETDAEAALCKEVMADPNFWLNFTSSLSQAIKKQLAN